MSIKKWISILLFNYLILILILIQWTGLLLSFARSKPGGNEQLPVQDMQSHLFALKRKDINVFKLILILILDLINYHLILINFFSLKFYKLIEFCLN